METNLLQEIISFLRSLSYAMFLLVMALTVIFAIITIINKSHEEDEDDGNSIE